MLALLTVTVSVRTKRKTVKGLRYVPTCKLTAKLAMVSCMLKGTKRPQLETLDLFAHRTAGNPSFLLSSVPVTPQLPLDLGHNQETLSLRNPNLLE